jgi:hypothetical protein
MNERCCQPSRRLSRRNLLAGCSAAAALAVLAGSHRVTAALLDQLEVVPTLLVYNTVTGLLAGDLQHSISPRRVQADVDLFPSDWVTLGVGTTNQIGRTGELIPDGSARDIHFWWADPSSPNQATVSDVEAIPGLSSVELPFIALGIADPGSLISVAVNDVSDVHVFLRQWLMDNGIQLAAVRLQGSFGEVMTTVSYNIPPTGIPTGSVYSGDAFFRFGDYPSGLWTMDGVYAIAQALQPVISTAGNPLHLHGYQPDVQVGGHIVRAAALQVVATIYPLQQATVRPAGFSRSITAIST